MFDPNAPLPDFAQQQASLEQQQLLAQALRKKAAGAQTQQGQMVSGHFVAPHWSQQLSPILDNLNMHMQNAKVGKAQADYGAGVRTARDQWMGSLPQSTPATPGRPELQGPPAEGGSPELAGVAPTPAQLPSRQSVLTAALRGMQIPGNEGAAQSYYKGAAEEQTREDNQAARKEDRDAQRQMARDNLMATLAQRQSEAEARAADQAATREARAAAQQEANDIKRYMAETQRMLGEAKAAKSDLKAMPSAQLKAWSENNSSMKFIDQALDKIAEHPQAFGSKNALGNAVRSRTDPKGVDARALVANIGSLKIHDRSGAAVTAAETPRLMPFIPIVNGPFADDAKTIEKKLKLFAQEYSNMQTEIKGLVETQGWKDPGDAYTLRDRSKKTATPTGAPKPGDVVDGYTFKGGDPANPASWSK